MGTVVILSLIFVVAPLVFMYASHGTRRRDHEIDVDAATNPELLRRPLRSRHPL
jgi:hypothetical protein